jgi:hypothetical protein
MGFGGVQGDYCERASAPEAGRVSTSRGERQVRLAAGKRRTGDAWPRAIAAERRPADPARKTSGANST